MRLIAPGSTTALERLFPTFFTCPWGGRQEEVGGRLCFCGSVSDPFCSVTSMLRVVLSTSRWMGNSAIPCRALTPQGPKPSSMSGIITDSIYRAHMGEPCNRVTKENYVGSYFPWGANGLQDTGWMHLEDFQKNNNGKIKPFGLGGSEFSISWTQYHTPPSALRRLRLGDCCTASLGCCIVRPCLREPN